VLCIIKTELDGAVVELTSYIEDSGNATPPVSHCDHNKINAAAVTKLSIPIANSLQSSLSLVTSLSIRREMQTKRDREVIYN
jgi:hypothetical protein